MRHLSLITVAFLLSIPALAAAQDLPATIRFCGPNHCGTLTWTTGHYDATYDDNAPGSTYMVESFTAASVKMHRIERDGSTFVLTGRLSPQGNSIVDGKNHL